MDGEATFAESPSPKMSRITDCGFGTSGAGDEVHPEVAWAKLRALVEGARIASQRLWPRR